MMISMPMTFRLTLFCAGDAPAPAIATPLRGANGRFLLHDAFDASLLAYSHHATNGLSDGSLLSGGGGEALQILLPSYAAAR